MRLTVGQNVCDVSITRCYLYSLRNATSGEIHVCGVEASSTRYEWRAGAHISLRVITCSLYLSLPRPVEDRVSVLEHQGAQMCKRAFAIIAADVVLLHRRVSLFF